MRPLIIDHKAIAALKEYAENNVVTTIDMQLTVSGKKKPVGDNPEHVLVLPVDYRIVFSIEAQPAGMVRHISISILGVDAFPNMIAAQLIAKEFGFRYELGSPDTKVWSEELIWAINIAEVIDEPKLN